MEKKKIGELIEGDTRFAVYRRPNGKTYCLLPSVTIGATYSSATGYTPIILPKRQVEVIIEGADGYEEAYATGNPVEDIDPQEEVEVLWDGISSKPEPLPDSDFDDDIPY